MEGPTPVSALIHAATMVTAGVYMCTRSAAIFTHAPIAMETVALIGLATAVFAATIGLAQNDIKKVFAYSTVSQLGYMFLGVGVGAFSAGVWHLMTHAFFKALLFLGAGSVIHACHGEQDMRHMGGLRKYAPIDMSGLCLRLAGDCRRSRSLRGFFSKDAILVAAYAACALDVLGRRDHRRHDRVLCLARCSMTFFGRIQGPWASARIALVDAGAAGGAGGALDRRAVPVQRSEDSGAACSRSRRSRTNPMLTGDLRRCRAARHRARVLHVRGEHGRAGPDRCLAGRPLHAGLQQILR